MYCACGVRSRSKRRRIGSPSMPRRGWTQTNRLPILMPAITLSPADEVPRPRTGSRPPAALPHCLMKRSYRKVCRGSTGTGPHSDGPHVSSKSSHARSVDSGTASATTSTPAGIATSAPAASTRCAPSYTAPASIMRVSARTSRSPKRRSPSPSPAPRMESTTASGIP